MPGIPTYPAPPCATAPPERFGANLPWWNPTPILLDHPGEAHQHGDLGERANKIRAAVLGANDGIVSVAGLVVGVAGATTSTSAIATAGVAAWRPAP